MARMRVSSAASRDASDIGSACVATTLRGSRDEVVDRCGRDTASALAMALTDHRCRSTRSRALAIFFAWATSTASLRISTSIVFLPSRRASSSFHWPSV